MKGRKRHIAVDTLGLIWALAVHAAHISETRGARLVLIRLYQVCPDLKKIFVDGGYFKGIIEWSMAMFGYLIEVVKRSDAVKGFQHDYHHDTQTGSNTLNLPKQALRTKKEPPNTCPPSCHPG